MANIQNTLTFNSGFNVTAQAPIDSRLRVQSLSDLTAENSWDMSKFPPYNGMIVAVMDTGQIYVLINEQNPYNLDNWKLASNSEEVESVLIRLDEAEDKITQNELKIAQTAEEILLLATKEELEKTESALKSEINVAIDAINLTISEQSNDLNGKIESNTTSIKLNNDLIQNTIANTNKTLESHQTQITQTSEQITNVAETVTKIENDLKITEGSLAEQTFKVDNLSAEVSTKASAESVTEIADKLTITNESLAEQIMRVTDLDAEIKTKASTESVTQMEGQLATVNQTVAEQIIRTDGIEASIENLVTKEIFNATTVEIEQRFVSVKQTTDNIETTIRSQEGEITSIKENVNGLSVGIGKVESDLDSLKNQIDGVTESFFYDYIPTLENEPAASWIENGTEAEHRGDTFTNTALTGEGAGKSWRWLQDENGNWGWTPIADTDAQKALLLASQAKAVADGKCATFHVQPSNYSIGDIWFVHNDDYAPYKKGEILTATNAGIIFSLSDWESLTRYSQAVDDLDAEMKGAFRDGVIDDAERKAIVEGLNALKSEKSGIDAGYNIVIINSDFTDAELKAEFKTAKTAYDSAYNALIAMVEEIINADLEELKRLFDEYNTLSDAYSRAVADYLDCKERVTEALAGRLNPASVYIDNITSDGKLTPIEKEQLFEIYRNIAREYDTNRGNAFNYKIWQYASDGVSEMQGNNGGNGRYETYTAYKESYAPIVLVFTSSIWGFGNMNETTTLPDEYSITQIKEYLDEYYIVRGALLEIFSAITAAIEDAQKAAEQTLSELTGILKPEEMTTLIGKGVVLSTIIATKDAKGNITAGMNASYEHAHPQYGRIVFAGGVADLSDWNSASFIVYETGHVVMQSGEVGNSVRIGRAMLHSVLEGDINLLSYPIDGELVPLFQVQQDENGKITVSSVYDLKVNGNITAVGEVSAGGYGEEGEGGSEGLDEEQLKQYLDENKYITEDEVSGLVPEVDLTPYATKTEVEDRIKDIIGGAPAAFDTLKEIADELENNDNAISGIITTLGTKASKTELQEAYDTHEIAINTLKGNDSKQDREISDLMTNDEEQDSKLTDIFTRLEEAERITALFDVDEHGVYVTDNRNFRSDGEISAGGAGEESDTALGTTTGIEVNGEIWYPDDNGTIKLPDYPTSLNWGDINGRPTKLSQFENDRGFATAQEVRESIDASIQDVSNTIDLIQEKDKNQDAVIAVIQAKDKAQDTAITEIQNTDTRQDESLQSLDERVTTNEGEISDMSELRAWYERAGKYIDRDNHGIYTGENFRSYKEISAGGIGTESDEEGGSGSDTLDGLLDVEIGDMSDMTSEEKESQVVGFDNTKGIWVNKRTMHIHKQKEASAVWTVTHGLNKIPNVKVIDSTGELVFGTVKAGDANGNDMMNVVRICFGGVFAGSAYLD